MPFNPSNKSKTWMITGCVAALSLFLSGVLLFRSTPDFDDHLIRVQYLTQAKEWNQSKEERDRILAIDPLHIPSKLNLALQYRRQNKLYKSMTEYQSVLQIEPENKEALLNLGGVYLAEEDFGKARRIFKRLLKQDPNDVSALIRIAETEIRVKNYKEAKAYLEDAVQDKQAELYPDAVLRLSVVEQFLDQGTLAKRRLEELRVEYPLYKPAYVALAALYQQGGEKLKYLKTLEHLYSISKRYEKVYARIGEFYRGHGYYQKAIDHYKEFLNSYPLLGEPYYFLGLTYLDKGQLVQAKEHFEKALSYDPSFTAANYYLGLTYLQMKQLDLAYANFALAKNAGFKAIDNQLVEKLRKTLHIFSDTQLPTRSQLA